ncbi:MAG TPA: c-type cytochrome [Aggregatilineales bacterium]|nr:c-type cytochrome [Anaerolineales bacterium]HRE46361.1 c-type cytochrome [Aggregatilineales bacterium]
MKHPLIVWGILLCVGVLAAFALILSGAAGGAPAQNAAQLTAEWCAAATSQAGSYVMIWDMWGTPTPTPLRGTPNPTATPTPVGVTGDSERGKALFFTSAQCSACHSVAAGEDRGLIGVSLGGVAVRAAAKRSGMSAALYLREVILNPLNVFPSTKPGVMPFNYAQTLGVQGVEDIVAYLLTLR